MRRYRKWVFTLGMLAVSPGLASAAPYFSAPPDANAAPAAQGRQPAAKSRNQKVAEDIAIALKKAAFRGYEIDIEYKDGQATLRGKVSDPHQKVRANEIVSHVAGVRRLDNQLVVVTRQRGPIRQTSAVEADHSVPTSQGQPGSEAAHPNQEKAMEIGRALQSAGLSGYDIEVLYQNGQAMLRGSVVTPEQRAAAAQAASSIPGVQAVNNQLRVDGPSAQPGAQPGANPYANNPYANNPYGMAAYQQSLQGAPMPATAPPMGPASGPPSMNPPGMPPGAMGPGGPGGPMPTGPVYDNPRLPDYAWPSYAQHPNYAAVTYPSQYSASAWPYIGPFYPYPQVPLNWRKVCLEWDDGHWDLKFDSKTDRWWWFMNPKNW